MGFFINQKNETRQYWSLSERAERIIVNDIFKYNLQKGNDSFNNTGKEMQFSKFVNLVFTNYAERAECSVVKRINSIKHAKSITEEDYKALRMVMYLIVEEKFLSDKGKTQSSRIHNRNIDFMRSCEEELIYDTPGKYFRAVLEEYSSLSVPEREKIIYKECFDCIDCSLEESRPMQIDVCAYSGREQHSFYPIKSPMLSNDGTAYYCVGIECMEENGDKVFRPYTIRVSQISSCKITGRNMESLSAEQKLAYNKVKEELENVLPYTDVSFVRFPIKEIKVRFTIDGIRKLENITHNRPIHIEKCDELLINDEKWFVRIFKCTAEQLMFYLHDFGKDAVVISPEDVCVKMKKFYLEADGAYKNCFNSGL